MRASRRLTPHARSAFPGALAGPWAVLGQPRLFTPRHPPPGAGGSAPGSTETAARAMPEEEFPEGLVQAIKNYDAQAVRAGGVLRPARRAPPVRPARWPTLRLFWPLSPLFRFSVSPRRSVCELGYENHCLRLMERALGVPLNTEKYVEARTLTGRGRETGGPRHSCAVAGARGWRLHLRYHMPAVSTLARLHRYRVHNIG